MNTRQIVIGNWKMNPLTYKEAEKLFKEIVKNLPKVKTEVVLCPPSIYLERLKKVSKKVNLGTQNIYPGDVGAFTGELSVSMLANLGAKYVIVGHSERRSIGESNQFINKKIKSALTSQMTPILCVGESERDSNHEYLNIVKSQLLECLEGVAKGNLSKVVIAYEPVWALSTTVNRHDFVPSEFLEIKIFIKKVLSDFFGIKTDLPRIIYGGSVNPENAEAFIKQGEADGLLPGRDSLNPKKFLEIIKIVENA